MAFFEKLYDKNFIEYASYVIKDRAIPHVDDGLKPVQRRILHALFEMDDGKFHKVANVVGQCMKYHPHGDASIFSALVVLANKDMFIEKQGNFGNIYTGDSASAARYIECRITKLAKEILYNPELTRFEDSYDGRNKEPVTYPSKIPVLLSQGTEGIAVGMATKILPHNLIELIKAQIACLKGSSFSVYPDFITGGFVDISDYNDGNGKVLVRARLDTDNPSKIIIREIPFGTTTESLIASIEGAARKNKIKISAINDYTAEDVEIEIRLSRGVRSADVVDALYAFTDCEMSISVNLLVVKDKKPVVMTVTDVIKHSTDRLVKILERELIIEQGHLLDRMHIKMLEQIFIERQVYKDIEKMTSAKAIEKAVFTGLLRYRDEIRRDVTKDDVDTLLKIPIRRISLYDIKKAASEIKRINKRLKEIGRFLNNITDYSVSFLEGIVERYGRHYRRRTKILSFKRADVRKAAQRDISLCYDKKTGYLGTKVDSDVMLKVSPYDRIIIIRKKGDYFVADVPEKLFVDKKLWFVGLVDKDRIYNIIYKDMHTGYPYIKRCRIDKFILGKVYMFLPHNKYTILDVTENSSFRIRLLYHPKPRMRTFEEFFDITKYPIRGTKAGGVRIARKSVKAGRFVKMQVKMVQEKLRF